MVILRLAVTNVESHRSPCAWPDPEAPIGLLLEKSCATGPCAVQGTSITWSGATAGGSACQVFDAATPDARRLASGRDARDRREPGTAGRGIAWGPMRNIMAEQPPDLEAMAAALRASGLYRERWLAPRPPLAIPAGVLVRTGLFSLMSRRQAWTGGATRSSCR